MAATADRVLSSWLRRCGAPPALPLSLWEADVCFAGERLDMRLDELEVNDTLVKSVVTLAAAERATFHAATTS